LSAPALLRPRQMMLEITSAAWQFITGAAARGDPGTEGRRTGRHRCGRRCHRGRDRTRVTCGLLCVSSPPAGSKLGTARGAAEGLLIVGCGYLSRYRTHGWAEAPL